MRMSASSRYAMSWASQDSSQCSTPASGATIRSATSHAPVGSPRLTARTTSALSSPTPMSAATRATPSTKVTTSRPW